ncbi:hypothetical protein K7X08_021511 [Anisodus acutangulus]|uniref:3'-5' exonuclease domain-containing protein n=1 Tax=Anisodus acutangulus TaxID=402998 RepID=A0A9Q1M4I6_9SOLA|nr:hypothetical protein K7X08_021511 [Anisodus acutangulus]
MVTDWITDVESDLFRSIVGLDIEWRPCFIRQTQSLLFQLLHCRYIPQSLVNFLDSCTFVGDVEKLERDHGLQASYSVDLRELAATAYEAYGMGDRIRRNAGLKELCSVVLTTSRWDYQWLNDEQTYNSSGLCKMQSVLLMVFVLFACLKKWFR